MEKLLEDGINAIGLGPQGMGGKYSVMGVNIENTARHPSTIGVAAVSYTHLDVYKRQAPTGAANNTNSAIHTTCFPEPFCSALVCPSVS